MNGSWVVAILWPLAVWVLLNGFDDLIIDVACVLACLRPFRDTLPTGLELESTPEQLTAILVPLWKEHRVIQNMVEHNIASQRYGRYELFLGTYPNDGLTLTAIGELVRRFPSVHLAVCPHDGPTSKADCLNWIYQNVLVYEERTGKRFETLLIHDAEDLLHPEALRWINFYRQSYDMVQLPVLALPTAPFELTHGVYCDDFAETQFKDLPARARLGGFVPSNGVGAGYSRSAMEQLAAANANRVFDPRSLTEDYEIGFRVHRLGLKQKFLSLTRRNGTYIATREYFPQTEAKAIRQRSRWVTGITLQSWEFHNRGETLSQLYWFWRDRKALLNNLLTPVTNAIFLTGLGSWCFAKTLRTPWMFADSGNHFALHLICEATAVIQLLHISMRSYFSGRVYGWKFAGAVPIRALWANWINLRATLSAIRNYAWMKAKRQPLVWLKTEHAYPHRAALSEHKRTLGEVLVGSGYVSAEQLAHALATRPPGKRLGEWLTHAGLITIDELYEALALQQNVELGRPAASEIAVATTRTFPAKVSRALSILPFRVNAGHLYIAGTEFPDERMTERIRQFCSLEIRFRLVTPADYAVLREQYLPG